MKLEFVYLVLALIFSVAYYFVNKKLIFDKHVHSKKLIHAMTLNLILNIIVTIFYAVSLFSSDGRIFEFLLRTPNVKNGALFVLSISLYILEVATVIVAARISIKRKGHKNLKLERILTSDFAVCAACGVLSTIALALLFIL